MLKIAPLASMIAILVALTTYSAGQSPSGPPNQQPAADQQQSQPEQHGTEQAPLVVPILPSAQTENKSSAPSTERPKEGFDAWLVGWGLSDKIAAIAIFVGFLQFCVLFATVAVMRRSAHRQLRAYVHIEDVVMSNMNNPNLTYAVVIQVIIKNFGRTPARQITNTSSWRPMRERESNFGLGGAQIVELPDLGPSQKTFSTFYYPRAIFQFWRQPVETGQMTFYVFGRIDYQDVFGKNWQTEYRFELVLGASGIPDETSLSIAGRAGNRTT